MNRVVLRFFWWTDMSTDAITNVNVVIYADV